MKLTIIASNVTEVELTGRITVLFSYKTPVAAKIWNEDTLDTDYFITDYKWSATTSRHIASWLRRNDTTLYNTRPQRFFDDIVEPI